MPTNNYPNIGYTTLGRDDNFFKKITVTAVTFGGGSVDGYQPDAIITFSTQGVIIINEDTSSIVEVSFNGNTVHDELNPAISRGFTYDDRVVSKIWLRLKTGSSAIVSIRAWAVR
jgi:hypothetical protein